MDEQECAALIKDSARMATMRGGTKIPTLEEKVTSDFAFATVCSIATINKGDIFSKENIWVKRPGTGELSAENYNEVLGKKATRDIPTDEQLLKSDLDEA
jgi:N-acetylneuraminate synthase